MKMRKDFEQVINIIHKLFICCTFGKHQIICGQISSFVLASWKQMSYSRKVLVFALCHQDLKQQLSVLPPPKKKKLEKKNIHVTNFYSSFPFYEL